MSKQYLEIHSNTLAFQLPSELVNIFSESRVFAKREKKTNNNKNKQTKQLKFEKFYFSTGEKESSIVIKALKVF